MIEAKQPTCSPTCNVTKCASKRCMTCKHLVLGSVFLVISLIKTIYS